MTETRTINQTDARAWVSAEHIRAKLRPVVDYHEAKSREISSLFSECYRIRHQIFELQRFHTFSDPSVGDGIMELLSKSKSLLMLADTSDDGRVLLGPSETSFVNNASTDRIDAEIRLIRDDVRFRRDFLQAIKDAKEADMQMIADMQEANVVVEDGDGQVTWFLVVVAAAVIALMVTAIAFAVGGANV